VIAAPAPDSDADGIADGLDNCVLVANPTQIDTDQDGYGNACDPDISNDGIVNFTDLAQLKRVFFTNDPMADLNGDGVVNFADLAIMKKAFFKKPGPAAGKP
jgi:predicted flap endonuclease-1-like 5' DNA nuclease